MRAWILGVVVFAACKRDTSTTVRINIPTAKNSAVLAPATKAPPVILFVGDMDDARIGAASTWSDLDAGKVRLAHHNGPIELLYRYVHENCGFDKPAFEAVKAWDGDTRKAVDVRAQQAKFDAANQNDDDPPPPEEEDDEIVGGPGVMISLEEGKMGKKDDDRAEGQYKMHKPDPIRDRAAAVVQARDAGIFSRFARDASFPIGAGQLSTDGTPSRVAQVEGTVMPDGLDRLCVMIAIAPAAKATTLIDVLLRTQGAIAVSVGGKVRPLNIQFEADDHEFHGFTFGGQRYYGWGQDQWLEVRVSANHLVIEAVSDTPIEVAKPDELADTLLKAADARGLDAKANLDVLVDEDVDAQRLIDVIVALDTAGAGAIGLGPMPSAEELARRGHRIPVVKIGQPNAQGDLDKKTIRKVVKQHMPEIRTCYERALANRPEIAGTVSTQFFISPDGIVVNASASGVAPGLAYCMEDVIKTMVFPKPGGGGGVQVNYPFTFRP